MNDFKSWCGKPSI
jgi:hypothetical protein